MDAGGEGVIWCGFFLCSQHLGVEGGPNVKCVRACPERSTRKEREKTGIKMRMRWNLQRVSGWGFRKMDISLVPYNGEGGNFSNVVVMSFLRLG